MKLKCRGYNIYLGCGIFENIGNFIDWSKYSNVIILTETKIYNLWKNKIDTAIKYNKLIQINSGEKMKNFDTAKNILNQLIKNDADRKSLLINIGGGMITDLGGFVASIYMRGIDYINCPTTLLAMVDASIGGKNGVNLEEIKNIIGCFNKPKLVIIDTSFLQTLPNRELLSAYGEIIKHSIIKSKKYFNFLIKNASEIEHTNAIDDIILHSLKIKKYFVEKDFQEKNVRKILNFGHTIGHGIETLSMQLKTQFLHGEAVLVGMFFETKIAEIKGILSSSNADKIYQCLQKYGVEKLLKIICKNDKTFNENELIKVIQKDKKNQKGAIKMVLPVKIGKCKYDILVNKNDIILAIRDGLKFS